MTYVGIYGGFTRNHARWGISETWTNPLISTTRYEPGYYEGAAAGSLSIAGQPNNVWGGAVYFDGTMVADTVNGERQIALSQPAAGGRLSITSQGSIVVSEAGKRLPDGIGIDSALPAPDLAQAGSGLGLWSWLSADRLSDIHLGSLELTTPGGLLVASDARVALAPGGSIKLTGGVIRLDGTLEAREGTIELRTLQHLDAAIYLPTEILALVDNLPGGVLTANTPAATDVVLKQDLVLAKGSVLPVAAVATVRVAQPGEALAGAVNLELVQDPNFVLVKLAAAWTVPVGAVEIYTNDDGFGGAFTNYLPGETIPAGKLLYTYGTLPAGYVVPKDAFPNGLPIPPVQKFLAAGTILSDNLTLRAGTYLSQGTTVSRDVAALPSLGRFGSITLGAGAFIDARGLWADDRVAPSPYGAKFIDGGAVTIATNASSTGLDNTGDIVLRTGSRIDASSGGHILVNGALATAKNGVPLGEGGDISILTYADKMFSKSSGNGAPFMPQGLPTASATVLNGTLASYGFTSGGTLTLRAGKIAIGPAETRRDTVVLGYGFFHDNGFGAYDLSSINDATILDGAADAPAIIAPRQRNYVWTGAAFVPGEDPLASGAVGFGLLSDYRRQAVHFALNGNVYYNDTNSTNFGVADQLVLGANTRILADAGADVRLSTGGKLIVAGEIHAPGGSIEIIGTDAVKYSGSNLVYSDYAAIWLAPTAVLDAGGAILLDDLPPSNGHFAPPRLGRVLDGGSVTVSHAQGYVVGMAGARIDVPGTAGELDVLRSSSDLLIGRGPVERGGLTPVNPYTRQAVWSDGGSINLGGSEGLYFDSTLNASGGGPEARGGNLNYDVTGNNRTSGTSPSAAPRLTSGADASVPPTFTLGQSLPFATYGVDGNLTSFLIRADLVQKSGADSLFIGERGEGAEGGRSYLTGAIDRGVSLSLPGSIRLAMGTVTLGAGSGPSAEIRAHHIGLAGGADDLGNPATVATGSLIFSADTIDLEGYLAFSSLSSLVFNAVGDVRLLGAAVAARSGENAANYTQYIGRLEAPGDITFNAGQVYPGTGQAYTLQGTSTNSTIRFTQNGTRPGVPLSAGGTLQITAPHIVQGGTVRAPQGTITFGVAGTTQSVDFLPGSLTSVSLEGATVPYGMTQDELTWLFNGLEIKAPPDKLISVAAGSVNLAKGAVLDLSAGGDLIGPEFVPGTGGSRDVLQQTITTYDANGKATTAPQYPDNRQIYAILPGYTGTRAPTDKTVAGTTDYGDVYLTGVPGLANGYYTLLPAQYAVLPGAYRVVARPGGDPRSERLLPDGTVIAAGFYAASNHAGRDAKVTLFEVQSRDVWRQYSEYNLTSANEFFGNLEVLHVGVAPYRPQDAGRLAVSASNQLVLQAQALFAAVPGGRGGRVDIGGRDLQILGPGGAAQAGYLGLFAADLTNLKAESILVGGTRSADGTGQLITAVANSLIVSNDAGSALVAPELLFAIKTDASGADPNAGNGLVFETGSVVIGEGAPLQTTPLRTSGDGALVRVSGGGLATISNSNAPANSIARVIVESGARLTGAGSMPCKAPVTSTCGPEQSSPPTTSTFSRRASALSARTQPLRRAASCSIRRRWPS
jgi:hypothetical protein